MYDFIDLEQTALQKCERIRILRTILNQPPQLFLFIQVILLMVDVLKLPKNML